MSGAREWVAGLGTPTGTPPVELRPRWNASQVDGMSLLAERRPLALLHANPAHTALVRRRHFWTAAQRIAQMHVDVLFGSEDAQMLEVLNCHLDDVEAAHTEVFR